MHMTSLRVSRGAAVCSAQSTAVRTWLFAGAGRFAAGSTALTRSAGSFAGAAPFASFSFASLAGWRSRGLNSGMGECLRLRAPSLRSSPAAARSRACF